MSEKYAQMKPHCLEKCRAMRFESSEIKGKIRVQSFEVFVWTILND